MQTVSHGCLEKVETVCLDSTYLQSNIAELTTLSQRVHFSHSGIQETLILKDQIPVWNHLSEF